MNSFQSRLFKEDKIFNDLEEAVDELFGEDFFIKFTRCAERIAEIEMEEYLGILKPEISDLAGQMSYLRFFRKLVRFRTEEEMRALLEPIYLEVSDFGTRTEFSKQDLIREAKRIKNEKEWFTDEQIRECLTERYNGN